jgi:alcohol dehydrogenase (cytochrome c)
VERLDQRDRRQIGKDDLARQDAVADVCGCHAYRGRRLFTGDLEGNFLVLDARSGETIYRFNTGGPLAGGVVTWEQKGQQYVAVASGHSGGSIPVTGSTTIVVFAY